MLLGELTGPRNFACSMRDPAQTRWSLDLSEVGLSDDVVVADGIDRLTLGRDDLPWSPQPYAAELRLVLRDNGVEVTWRIIVIPHPDALFPETDL